MFFSNSLYFEESFTEYDKSLIEQGNSDIGIYDISLIFVVFAFLIDLFNLSDESISNSIYLIGYFNFVSKLSLDIVSIAIQFKSKLSLKIWLKYLSSINFEKSLKFLSIRPEAIIPTSLFSVKGELV